MNFSRRQAIALASAIPLMSLDALGTDEAPVSAGAEGPSPHSQVATPRVPCTPDMLAVLETASSATEDPRSAADIFSRLTDVARSFLQSSGSRNLIATIGEEQTAFEFAVDPHLVVSLAGFLLLESPTRDLLRYRACWTGLLRTEDPGVMGLSPLSRYFPTNAVGPAAEPLAEALVQSLPFGDFANSQALSFALIACAEPAFRKALSPKVLGAASRAPLDPARIDLNTEAILHRLLLLGEIHPNALSPELEPHRERVCEFSKVGGIPLLVYTSITLSSRTESEEERLALRSQALAGIPRLPEILEALLESATGQTSPKTP